MVTDCDGSSQSWMTVGAESKIYLKGGNYVPIHFLKLTGAKLVLVLFCSEIRRAKLNRSAHILYFLSLCCTLAHNIYRLGKKKKTSKYFIKKGGITFFLYKRNR